MPEAAEQLISYFDRSRVAQRGKPSGAFFSKPCVALTDRGTRSVKELVAFEWRRRKIGALVGQRTRGAFLGVEVSGIRPLSDGSLLMVPSIDMRPVAGGVDIEGEGDRARRRGQGRAPLRQRRRPDPEGRSRDASGGRPGEQAPQRCLALARINHHSAAEPSEDRQAIRATRGEGPRCSSPPPPSDLHSVVRGEEHIGPLSLRDTYLDGCDQPPEERGC